MGQLENILLYNEKFVENKEYEVYQTARFPYKKMVVLTCMDTRIAELLPKAMDLNNGDAKIIKNAGAVITHPFGSIMRSIFVAIYELKAEEVYVIGHHGCGMNNIDPTIMIEKMKEKGILEETLSTLKYGGVDLNLWLRGFDCIYESVKETVERIRKHPLMPKSISVHGLVIDPETGALEVIVNGDTYKE